MRNAKYRKRYFIPSAHDIEVTPEENELFRYKGASLSYKLGHASKVTTMMRIFSRVL